MDERERFDCKLSVLYEVRLAVSNSDKENFTKEDIGELLDSTALLILQARDDIKEM